MEIERLRELQLVQLKVMDEIHKICLNNQLNYYLIGGSALGAVRHKGFIPWDVDIDIAMPRKDYELFVTKYSKLLPESLFCVDYRTDRNLYSPHAIVVMKGTKLVQRDDYLNPQFKRYGIFVDILPLDQVPSDNKLWERQQKDLRRWSDLRYRKLSIIYSSNSTVERFLKILMRFSLFWLPLSFINKKQSEIMLRYDSIPSSMCYEWCSMASHYSFNKLTMPKGYFGIPRLMQFENREYFVPENVNQYLEHLFGDYMKLPSKEKQQEMLDYFVDASW